jgi:hypothetical protein
MTMKQDLMARLLEGWTSPLDALMCCDCLSLSQRVGEFRRAHEKALSFDWNGKVPPRVIDRWVTTASGKRHKEYRAIR